MGYSKSIQQVIAERKRERKFACQLLMLSTIVHLVVLLILIPVKLSWENIKIREKPMVVTITKPLESIEPIKRAAPPEPHIRPRPKEVAKKELIQPASKIDAREKPQRTELIKPDELNLVELTKSPKSLPDTDLIDPQFFINAGNNKSPGPVADAMPIPEFETGQGASGKSSSITTAIALISPSEFSTTEISKPGRQTKGSGNSFTADECTVPVLLNKENVRIQSPEPGGPFREVIIELWVNEEGKPEDVSAWYPKPPYNEVTKRYVDAAVEAGKKYLFRPAMKNNLPVRVLIRIPIQFNIRMEASETAI